MTVAQSLPFTFLKQLKTSAFLSFALKMNSDESQSQAQFNTQSFGENKVGHCAENTKFVSRDENFKKNPHLFTLPFHTLLIMYCYAKMPVRYQLIITFMFCYC